MKVLTKQIHLRATRHSFLEITVLFCSYKKEIDTVMRGALETKLTRSFLQLADKTQQQPLHKKLCFEFVNANVNC